jgi:hypothetical protein
MFVLMTATALGLGFLVAAPLGLLALTAMLLSIAVPMVLTIGLIYGRGWLRTFCIGALFPAGILFLSAVPMLVVSVFDGFDGGPGGDDVEERLFQGLFVVVAGIVIAAFGLLAIWVRWAVERVQNRQPATRVPLSEAPIDLPPPASQRQDTPD